MELTLNVGFGQIVDLLSQLPANQIIKIKNEFTDFSIAEKAKVEISDFQKFILGGPVMSDEQYSIFNQQRLHFSAWRPN